MKTQQEIKNRQENFLSNYNPMHSEERAIQSGINAAIRFAHVYTPGTTYQQKIEIKRYWEELLKNLGKKYEKMRTEREFLDDITSMVALMNKKFPNDFNYNEDHKGFRIAQAQKSLSVYLKHMWCLGKTQIPPVCPIDRTVLGETWIYDDLEMYKNHLCCVKKKNNTDNPLSVWELFEFYR